MLLCVCEIYDGFSGSGILANASLLTALNLPEANVLASEGGRAAHSRVLNHLRAYNKTLVERPREARP